MVIIKFTFDKDKRYEYPVLTLANIDRTELEIMTQVKELVITPRFNNVSEMTFKLYKSYNNVQLLYYDWVVKNRLVHVEGFGWWIIHQVTETFDGGVPVKEINCYSYEYVLNYKGVNIIDGTYKFYDELEPQDTLLYKLFSIVPRWHIGHVDIELCSKYRTFDISDATLYGFLMDEVASTYKCIFQFDTENLIVNVYEAPNIVKETDIMVTFDNVAKQIKLEELDTDIATVLRVNGADNLSINVVNPLGDNRLYDFSYYMNDEWIGDQDLIQKIKDWQELVENKRTDYADLLVKYRIKNREILTATANLTDLKAQLEALELVRKDMVPNDPESEMYEEQQERFKEKTNEVDAKNIEIKNKQTEIDTKKAEMETITSQLTAINTLVKFENYFTHEEQVKLSDFIIESVYTDSNFVVTDAMTIPSDLSAETIVLTTTGAKKFKDMLLTDVLIDETYVANQLLDEGRKVLKTVSQPNFTFSLDTTNFLFIEKFKPFIDQINLGCLINVEIQENDWVQPILLELTLDYDNPENFSMVFGNRFRLSNAEWTFAELHNEQVKTSSRVGTTLQIASEPVLNGTVSDFKQYMTNNLIAANQQIQSTADNEITFGGFGLRGRKLDPTNATGYDPHQLWISNNLICMTDDNWQTTKLAIGQIGGKYAVNAEVVAGTLLAGEQLTIKNNDNSFVVDANGAKLTNASLEVTTRNRKNRIILNPDVGIELSRYNESTGKYDTNALVFSEAGVLEFTGTLKAANGVFTGQLQAATGSFSGKVIANEGDIGGWEITSSGLSSPDNSYIYLDPDGTVYASELSADSGFIGGWHFSTSDNSSTFGCGEITLKAIGASRVKNKETKKYETIPARGEIKIGNFIIGRTASSNNYYITTGSSVDKGPWGMGADNAALAFYAGYNGGNIKEWSSYNFQVNSDTGLVSCRGIRLGNETIYSWNNLEWYLDIEGGGGGGGSGGGWSSTTQTTDPSLDDGDFIYTGVTGKKYKVIVTDGLIQGFASYP